MKINVKQVTKIYLVAYLILMFAYCSIDRPMPIGEWDDYSLPSVSIMYEHNISISDNDVKMYKQVFPEWSNYISSDNLSGFKTRSGDKMTWYFPTYSVSAIPYILLLKALGLPATYAYMLTNFTVMMALLLVVLYCMNIGEKKKLALIVLLSANPIIFYFGWISAETFIFSMIGLAMVFWHNKAYKRAALFISIAGTLNPTIMIIGMAIILDFFVQLDKVKENTSYIRCVLKNKCNIIEFALCFVISLVPLAYNYYNTGHISLTASINSPASYSCFTQEIETTVQRFIAYLFDANFGMLPYYNVLFLIALILIPIALYKKQWKYVLLMAVFFGNIYLYSIMIHINSGMSGISRYNAWGAVIMIFAVCCYFDQVINRKAATRIVESGFAVTAVLSTIIVFNFGLVNASNTSYVEMTPIAKWVLNNMPSLYNPLKSTFNSRVTHVDGGYQYETPIVYTNENGKARKILASSKDKQQILDTYYDEKDQNAWLMKQVNQLGSQPGYISVSPNHSIEKCPVYQMNENILFYSDAYNADNYVISGLSVKEKTFSWTNGNALEMRFRLPDNSDNRLLFSMELGGVCNNPQEVFTKINGKAVYHSIVNGTQNIEFDFNRPDDGFVDISFTLPTAVSPASLGHSADTRKLALAIRKVAISNVGA